MKPPLRILLLEDDHTDADLIQQHLIRNKLHCEVRVAMSKNEYLQSLDQYRPEVVLSDNSMPQFNSSEALHALRQRFQHVPFILVTGTVSEEYAIKMIKEGADDYILKDRMTRLPAAIDAALAQRRTLKEITDYRYALDEAAIVAITDHRGIILYANQNFCQIAKYTVEELVGKDHRIVNSAYHLPSYFQQLWKTIAHGQIWRGEFRNCSQDGNIYWVDATIVPFLDESGKPYQYLSIQNDISQKKKLEHDLLEQQRLEQLNITSTALQAEEKVLTQVGRELHDNVNQILVGTKLYLSMISGEVQKNKELITVCMETIQTAIDENRKIAHNLVTPDFELKNLVIQLRDLTAKMLNPLNIEVDLDETQFTEDLLTQQQKLTVYRIAQEQSINIIKYAGASSVKLILSTKDQIFNMTIADNGKGLNTTKKIEGIGIQNIKGRLSLFEGYVQINSEEGKGFELIIRFPLSGNRPDIQ